MKWSRVAFLLGVSAVVAGVGSWRAAEAFNPQPDPPGFGMIGILPDEIIRLNVVCFDHRVGGIPPGPCSGELMFHDEAGNVVARKTVDLKPGESAHLDFQNTVRVTGDAVSVNRFEIDPCWLPAVQRGRAIPSAEVIDATTGRTTLFLNVAAPRMSFFARLLGDGSV